VLLSEPEAGGLLWLTKCISPLSAAACLLFLAFCRPGRYHGGAVKDLSQITRSHLN